MAEDVTMFAKKLATVMQGQDSFDSGEGSDRLQRWTNREEQLRVLQMKLSITDKEGKVKDTVPFEYPHTH